MCTLECGDFFARAGWHCQTINAGSGPATYISTPITLPGGKPLDFYLIQRGDLIEFTDDGITLFALRSIGYTLSDKRNWKGLDNLGLRFGFQLTDAGAFEATFPQSEMDQWGGKIIRLMASIAAWEEERSAEGDSDFSLTDEIEMLLRAKDPDRKIIRNASLQVGKIEMSFDFLWGDTYIDAVAPLPQSVNARLRKAVLISKVDDPADVLFIVDDRGGKKRKAEDEIAVLGSLASTILLSDFQQHYSSSMH
ncbi:DUF1828 domain-containing protein [Pseudomonas qingdaonensis]|uniref:DUF1828 domain-containing protein n=1 Tax=Pseudomonas qingdaonensis TaxID=2056231 RepID=UPI0018CAEA36|nr:DUF1828 domain-containing protein [Pseudomonas qingdaonensis]MBG8559175.1 DUF1828 domain-containing protein [Pseudomonas qingdaonensis]